MSKHEQIQQVANWHRTRAPKGNPHGRGKPKPVTLSTMPTSWDRGAEGRANQERLRTEAATDFNPETGKETPNPNGIKRRRRQAWLRIYEKSLGQDGAALVASGEALRMAAEGMRERDPLASLSGISGAGESDPEAARVDARAYFRERWALIPAASRPVVQRVVLDDEPIWHGNPASRERHMQRLIGGLTAIR